MKQQTRIRIVGNVSILRFLIIIYAIVSFAKSDEKLVTSEDITELLKAQCSTKKYNFGRSNYLPQR